MLIHKVFDKISLFAGMYKIRKLLEAVHSLNSTQLWNTSCEVIIGGCGLLSKRPTRYSARTWPTYMRKTHGIKICSWDNITYRDFTEFSIGCALLGYRPKSHSSIKNQLSILSPLSSLLSPYEPTLAIELNKFLGEGRVWKFCRGGGEALAITVRMARSVALNTRVLVCGYHGTHDWYLSSNLSTTNDLSQVFLGGISVDGIPQAYSGTTVCLRAFSAESLQISIARENPGVIFFEACRYELLNSKIVEILKDFQAKGGVLVADEVTSGFRFKSKLAVYECGIIPDFIVLGKSLGNGYAISAVGAFSYYSDKLESCFLSSTHWTESIGLQAGVCSLHAWKKWDIFYNKISENGKALRQAIINSFTASGLSLIINDVPTMITYQIAPYQEFSSAELRTLLINRMLAKKFLLSTTIYPSIKHTRRQTSKLEKALTECCSALFYDATHNKDVLRTELENMGNTEMGFARTQKL